MRVKIPVLLDVCLVHDVDDDAAATPEQRETLRHMATLDALEHVQDYLARVLAAVHGYRIVGHGSVAGNAFRLGQADEVAA